MDENPFDKDERNVSASAFGTSGSSPFEEKDTSGRPLVWLALGIMAMCCGVVVAGALFYFKPDAQSLIGQYFPSPTLTPTFTPTQTSTPTITPSPTSTPTPNLTATQQILDVTATVESVQGTATQVFSKWKVVLSETFDSNKKGWLTGPSNDEYSDTTYTLENGVYKWDTTAHKNFIGWIRLNEKSYSNFMLTVQVKQTVDSGSSDCGLILREDAGGNFYYFGITTDQQFLFARYYNNEWSDLIGLSTSDTLLPDQLNRLTVIAEGDHFTLFINDQFVGEAFDDKIQKGRNAMAVELSPADSHAVYEFDNLELRVK